MNASGSSDVDILVVATNTEFSNPTRDWVANWQMSHPRPVVRLWNRHDLERLFCERPEVVIRLFTKALSIQGKLEVVRSRFWNYQIYAGEPLLQELWKHRHDLDWSHQDIIAVVASECANGSVSNRPWTNLIADDQRLCVLVTALTSILYFCFRADDVGVSQTPYIDGAAYLLLSSLQSNDWRTVSGELRGIWKDTKKSAGLLRAHALRPVLAALTTELRDVCTDDCRRILTDPMRLSEGEIDGYWRRLRPVTTPEKKRERLYILVERENERCNVGFKVNKRAGCPLVRIKYDDETPLDIDETLATLSAVVSKRGSAATS